MKYAVEMGSDAMIYIPSFMKVGSGIQNLIEVIHRHTDSRDIAKTILIFCRLKICLLTVLQFL
jgi:hypothetical protein